MHNDFYVYYLIDPTNEKPFYVGKGHGYSSARHLHEKSGNKHKYYTIKKIIKENKTPLIIKLMCNIDEKCAFCFERFMISLIGRRDINSGPLTNLTDGGEGTSGWVPSSKWIEQSIKRKTGVKIHSDQNKLNIKMRLTGANNPMKQKEISIKHGKSRVGRKDSMESRLKKREKRLGNKNPNFGKLGPDNKIFGRKWVFNQNLKINKLIKKEEISSYLNDGWKEGFKKDYYL